MKQNECDQYFYILYFKFRRLGLFPLMFVHIGWFFPQKFFDSSIFEIYLKLYILFESLRANTTEFYLYEKNKQIHLYTNTIHRQTNSWRNMRDSPLFGDVNKCR